MSLHCKVLIFLTSFSAFSNFQLILNAYEKNSIKNQIYDLETKILRADSDNLNLMYKPFLDASLYFQSGREPSLFSFQSQQSSQTGSEVNLVKNFTWGGKIGLKSSFEFLDVSKWANTGVALNSDGFFTFRNEVFVEKDLLRNFWGNPNRYDFQNIEKSIEVKGIQNKEIIEQDKLKLYSTYLELILNEKVKKISAKTLKNLKKRQRQVNQRFADGVSTKSEKLFSIKSIQLLQRNMLSEIQKETELKDVLRLTIKNPTFQLQTPHHFPEVSESHYQNLNVKESHEQKRLEKLLEIDEINLLKIKEKEKNELSLRAGYRRSSIDPKFFKSFENSFSSGEFDSTRVSLHYKMPLGGSQEIHSKQTRLLNIQKNKLLKDEAKKNIELKLEEKKNKISQYKLQMIQIQKIIRTSKNISREQFKLYQKGRADYESVLNAQGEAYELERNLVQLEFLFHLDILGINYLAGNLNNYLKGIL